MRTTIIVAIIIIVTTIISSDRSSYSDSVLLLVRGRQLFQILSMYANIAIMNDVLWCFMMFYDVL